MQMLTRHQLKRFVEAHLALGEQSHGYRILVLRDRQRVRRAQAVVASNKKPVRFFCGTRRFRWKTRPAFWQD
ncbi:MAG: hypothetical protein QGH07_02880, partial [Alphaproteobacteria bacterium]|nr:hypothetical protein [Alphaproteobacteria bacterium]